MAHALKNAGKKKSVHNVREEFQCIVDPPNPLHTNTNTDAQTQDANTGTHHHNHKSKYRHAKLFNLMLTSALTCADVITYSVQGSPTLLQVGRRQRFTTTSLTTIPRREKMSLRMLQRLNTFGATLKVSLRGTPRTMPLQQKCSWRGAPFSPPERQVVVGRPLILSPPARHFQSQVRLMPLTHLAWVQA